MIEPREFIQFLEKTFQYACGVPCSYFKDFLAYLVSHGTETRLQHVITTREDEALGIASGVAFSGKRAVVYLQNSGLGNIGDALTSLVQLYKLPMLLLVSYRGLEPDNGFPEHSIMGDVTEPVLKAFKVPYLELTEETWQEDLENALERMEETSSTVALLVRKGVLSQ